MDEKEETVKDVFEGAEADIQHLKVHGMSTVVVIRLFERMLGIIKTIAINTGVARVRKE